MSDQNHSATAADAPAHSPKVKGRTKRTERRAARQPQPDDLIDLVELSGRTGLTIHALEGLRRKHKLPPAIKFGTARSAPIRWKSSDIDAWIESQAQEVA